MGNLIIKTKRISTSALFTDEVRKLSIDCSCDQNMVDNKMLNINGAVNDTAGEKPVYIGSFSGNATNSTMSYNFSNISDLTRLKDIVDSVTEIEALLKTETE